MKDNRENAIVLNSAQALKKAGFPDSSIERFNDDAVSLLNDYAELFGEGTAISVPFLVVLIILTLELSIASPGTTSSWAIMLASLGMPTSYVGMFAAYRMLTANYEAACTTVYSVLEQVEAAKKMDAIEKQPI